MTEEVPFLYQKFVMDISDSINYDKEQMLEAMVESSGLSPEEFSRDWIIEEYPIEIFSKIDISHPDHEFIVSQNFRVRLKTEEERQLEIESKEINDESGKL